MLPEVALSDAESREIKTPDYSSLTRITLRVCSTVSPTVPQSDGAPGAHSLSQLPSLSYFPTGIFWNHLTNTLFALKI